MKNYDISYVQFCTAPLILAKIERYENCKGRNLTYKFCAGTHYDVSRMLTDRIEDTSIAMLLV